MNLKARWNEFWLAPFSPKILALFRIGICSLIFLEVARNSMVSSFLSANEARYFANGFYSPYFSFLKPPSYNFYLLITRVFFIFSFMALIGLFTQISLLFSAGIFFYLFFLNKFFYLNHFYSLGLAIVLCAFMPCAEVWACDALRKRQKGGRPPELVISWAARLMQMTVAIMYIGSATSKVYPAWLSGASLKMLYESDALTVPVFFKIVERIPYSWQAWLTLATEYFLAFGLWWPPILIPALGAGLIFHVFLNYSMGIGQFSLQVLIYYLLFMNPLFVKTNDSK